MKAFKVRVGYKTDCYGYPTNEAIEEYFFNEEDAKRRYKEGEYITKKTQITITFKDGSKCISHTHKKFFEKYKASAMKNEKVELVDIICNNFALSEIEIN